jgi:hypothetical protein
VGPCRNCKRWTCICKPCVPAPICHPQPMTEEQFLAKFGHKPVNDDLDRINCRLVGDIGSGHSQCGLCRHGMAKFMVCYDCRPELRDRCEIVGKFLALRVRDGSTEWQVRATHGGMGCSLVIYDGPNAEKRAKDHVKFLSNTLHDMAGFDPDKPIGEQYV